MTQPDAATDKDSFPMRTIARPMENIRRVLIVGAGTMGSGIAQVVAEAGFDTMLTDADGAALDRGLSAIARRWQQSVERVQRSADDAASFAASIHAGSLSDVADADLVVEAILEDIEIKSRLFQDLATAAPPETLFASNTSSISSTALGQRS